MYLDVVAIRHDGQHYTFADNGPVVEYALKMRRLPADYTLEALLRRGAVTPQTMEELARLLVAFHSTHTPPGPPGRFGTLAQVLADWQENFAQTADCVGNTLPPHLYTQALRQRMATLAREIGADFYVLECLAPEAVTRERLEQRQRVPGAISDGRWEIFPQFQRDYEPVQAGETAYHVRVETTQNLELCVQQALAAIQEGRG